MKLTDDQKMMLSFIPVIMMVTGALSMVFSKLDHFIGVLIIFSGEVLLIFIGSRKDINEIQKLDSEK